MDLFYIVLTSVGSVAALFILTKIIGNKQMSQLSMFDYINGITIGSIAAEMATALEDFTKPLVALLTYTALSVLISWVSLKSIRLRRVLTGKSLILYESGKLYEGNLKKARIDVNEFFIQCRNSGYWNIANLQSAIMEPNGKISFLPLASHRPVKPSDLNIAPSDEKPVINVIIDGKVLYDNLKFTGNNAEWLKKKLDEQGYSNISEVFLATLDNQNNLSVYVKIKEQMTRDIFQ